MPNPARVDDVDMYSGFDVAKLVRATHPAGSKPFLAQLAGTPYPDPGILHARLDRANQRLAVAEAIETALKAEHEAASTQRARRRDPDGPERTRRELQEATNTVADARADVATVRLTVDTLPDDITARRRVTDRLEAVDRALDHRVHEACEHPARYLTEALGPRIEANARRWDVAGEAIETYRHKYLGLEPNGPPVKGDEPLGIRPQDQQSAQAWERAAASIEANAAEPPEHAALRIGR